MTSPPPRVTVVIPTRNRRASLLRLLALLEGKPAPVPFDVVVAVDGSTDGTRESVAALDPPYRLSVVEAAGPGRASACNAGLERARGEVVLILDDDMEPEPELVSSHHRHHVDEPRVCVMGAVPVSDQDRTPVARYTAARFREHHERLSDPDHVFVPRDFYTGNTSIRREVLLAAGAFDDVFDVYGNEDVELFLRLRQDGVEFRYDDHAVAWQRYSKTFSDLVADTSAKGRTAVMLTRRHPEAFGELQLAQLNTRFRRWPTVRAALLAVTRRRPAASRAVAVAASIAERAAAGRWPSLYLFVLDYFFWSGVADALSDATPSDGQLAQLAADLERGPLDLLLHR